MSHPKRNALGRGLESLIPMDDTPARGTSAINDIEISQIQPNPEQPRTNFDEEAIGELAASIRELGIIQPISLRKIGPDNYQIIAGERRYRAAKLAGLTSVPAYIRTANEAELTEMALIENIQREDLNAIEIALTFKKLIDQYELTQERLSERIGKKRATIANFLRLLKLPAEVQLGLRDKRVDMGHARALLTITDPSLQLKLYNEILRNGLSVRKVEELAKAYQNGETPKVQEKEKNNGSHYKSSDFDLLKKHLSATFNTPVQFTCDKGGKGRITFPFKNEEELERLITLFDNLKQQSDKTAD
ncbi:MAG: ParB/RepB/Spo0J family partition protein [Muribaculaceae bacterium]|nr:ParB/RepB/Spo0J family partition protein [Muribaculaceae bacterium]